MLMFKQLVLRLETKDYVKVGNRGELEEEICNILGGSFILNGKKKKDGYWNGKCFIFYHLNLAWWERYFDKVIRLTEVKVKFDYVVDVSLWFKGEEKKKIRYFKKSKVGEGLENKG